MGIWSVEGLRVDEDGRRLSLETRSGLSSSARIVDVADGSRSKRLA
jgi:hypothetical protein